MQLVDYIEHQKTIPHAGGCKMWLLEHGVNRYRSHKLMINHDRNIYINTRLRRDAAFSINGPNTLELVKGIARPLRYDDLVIDGVFTKEELEFFSNKTGILAKKHSSHFRTRFSKSEIWGIDPYGNTFFKDINGNLYFQDHENDEEPFPIMLSEMQLVKHGFLSLQKR